MNNIVTSKRNFLIKEHIISSMVLNLVPLHNFDAFRFLKRIIGVPILKLSLYGGSPDGFKEFKNSIVISTALF